MTKKKLMRKNLEAIRKYGDMYDAVTKKYNRSVPQYSLIRHNVLFLSRIAYLFCLPIFRSMDYFTAPIEKIKQNQEAIRKFLKIPVDIIHHKNEPKYYYKKIWNKEKNYLYLYYENEGVNLDTYIENLKRIKEFCSRYQIATIVKASDLPFSLENQKELPLKKFLKLKDPYEKDEKYPIEEKLEANVIVVNKQELSEIIKQLESYKIDKQAISEFGEKIEDLSIKQAISSFLITKDVKELKNRVERRLSLILNSDTTYKKKEHGKVNEVIQIKEDKLVLKVFNEEGIQIETDCKSIYDYLEVNDFCSLLKKARRITTEESDSYWLSALHLYLCERDKKITKKQNQEYKSLYDYMYQMTKEKKKHLRKNIPGLYTKKQVIKNRLFVLLWNFIFFLYLRAGLLATKDIFSHFAKEEPSPVERGIDFTFDFYQDVWDWEDELLHSFLPSINILPTVKKSEKESTFDFFNNKNDGKIGDVTSTRDEKIFTITPLQENISLPKYYAKSYGFAEGYRGDSAKFEMTNKTIYDLQLVDAEPLFTITQDITENYMEFLKEWGMKYPITLYPLEENYGIIEIEIRDKQNLDKKWVWDKEREQKRDWLTEEEQILLTSLQEPEIIYTYGIAQNKENAFVKEISDQEKYWFYISSREEIIEAIKKGLQLDSDATNEQIKEAIKNKNYSKTPLKDARITEEELREKTETQYFETIASLDSLVCNLAATLAAVMDENHFYTIGYLNQDDNYITTNEAHAWATDREGNIIEVTPAKQIEIQDIIVKVVQMAIKNDIPLYFILAYIALKLKQIYGTKIIFKIKVEKVKRTLESPTISESYAKLNEHFYGGRNIPRKKETLEMVNTIRKEYYGTTKEDLQELKQELLKKKNVSQEEIKLMDTIPFIVQNAEELKRSIQRKKNFRP